jgi:biotin synthase-like enzyme
LLAHKMNRGPGGQQPLMHDTVNPLTGETQTMVYSADSIDIDSKGVSLAEKAKGMEQVLRERGILQEMISNAKNGKVVGVCKDCSQSQAARDKARKEAKARQDEVEGSGLPALADRSECESEEEDLSRSRTCCMQRVLSLQPDFKQEKPLLQLVIEKAGHKCLFLPKFHCELNPIEMVWGQAKRRESPVSN